MQITTSDETEDLAYSPNDGEEQKHVSPDEFELFLKLKRWAIDDMRHSGEWRDEAKDHYDMVAGRQWSDAEEHVFREQGKVPIKFNRVLSIIKSVAGHEINNRHELFFYPRNVEDTAANDTLNAASSWMGDNCDAEDEESDAFEDTTICGMGWTEHLIEYDIDVQGMYTETRVDPLEMGWDRDAKRKNLADARRIHRVKKDIDIEDARRMFPGIPDVALDASWIKVEMDHKEAVPIELRRENELGEGFSQESLYTRQVTIVETQWFDLEPYYLVAGQDGDEPVEMSVNQYEVFSQRAQLIGFQFEAVKLDKRVYKRAFLGANGILEQSASPAGNAFTYTCITGERDRNKGLWFGLVAVMADPQKFANKFLTNTLHILNVLAKGGVMAEHGAFEDPRQAEDSWAQPNEITWLADGALSGQKPKLQEKPVAQFPVGYWNMMEFAISSIRDTSGVNLELLGMVDRNQPGILEAQRKQAGMTILATLFNNLRRFRKAIGRVRLHFIQNYLSDGRLIRITGPSGKKAVPLLRDKTLGTFDVVVDEAGNSINQKEVVWQMIVSVLPIVKDMITPKIFFSLLRYSPLPESLLSDLERMMQEGQSDPQAEQQQQLLMQQLIAKIERDKAASQKDQSASMKNQADAQKTMAEIGKTSADIEKVQSDTARNYSEIDRNAADVARTETDITINKAQLEQMGSIADPAVQNLFRMSLEAQRGQNTGNA